MALFRLRQKDDIPPGGAPGRLRRGLAGSADNDQKECDENRAKAAARSLTMRGHDDQTSAVTVISSGPV